MTDLFMQTGLDVYLGTHRVDLEAAIFNTPRLGLSSARIPRMRLQAMGKIFSFEKTWCARNILTGPIFAYDTETAETKSLCLFSELLLLGSIDKDSDPRDKMFAILVMMQYMADAQAWAGLPLERD